MSKKHETLTSETLFYCFVDFAVDAGGNPFTYVIPAPVVAAVMRESHRAWLTQPGRGGKPRNDNSMRRMRPDYSDLELSAYAAGWLDQYREAWHLLGETANTAAAT